MGGAKKKLQGAGGRAAETTAKKKGKREQTERGAKSRIQKKVGRGDTSGGEKGKEKKKHEESQRRSKEKKKVETQVELGGFKGWWCGGSQGTRI